MQQNNFSEKDLDQLLNRSFLEMDPNDPKHAGMAEIIANQTFSQKSLLRKLTERISLQALVLSCVAFFVGTIALIAIHNDQPISPKINAAATKVHPQSHVATTSKTETAQEQSISPKRPATSNSNMYKKSAEQNNTTSWETYNDSTSDNLVIQLPEAIHFNDPPLIVLENDSIPSKPEEKHNKQIKRKPKSRWREHEVK